MIQMNQPEALVWRLWDGEKLNTMEITRRLNGLMALGDLNGWWTESQVHTMIRDISDRNYVEAQKRGQTE